MLTESEFYLNEYGGKLCEERLGRLLPEAERDVWCVCSEEIWEEIKGGGNEEGAKIIKAAVCVQADFLAENYEDNSGNCGEVNSGEEASADGNFSGAEQVISSVKLGDFSVNFKSNADSSASGNSSANNVNKNARGSVCGEALLILDRGGFLYRGGVRV